MSGPNTVRVLVLDGDPGVIEDYALVLGGTSEQSFARDWLSDGLDRQMLAAARARRGFPTVDLVAVRDGAEAIEAVRQAVAAQAPFAIAFVDVSLSPGLEGVRTAEDMRMHDPDLQIVLVPARGDLDPVELSARIPPADRLFLVQKPFQAAELQQLVLALAGRRRNQARNPVDRGPAQTPVGDWTGLMAAVEALPAAVIVFDRDDGLTWTSAGAASLLPELAEVLVPGLCYADLRRELDRHLVADCTPVHGDVPDPAGPGPSHGAAELVEFSLSGAPWMLLAARDGSSGHRACLLFHIGAMRRQEVRRTETAVMAEMRNACIALCALLDRRLARPTGTRQRDTGRSDRSKVTMLSRRHGPDARGTEMSSLVARMRAVGDSSGDRAEAVTLDHLISDIIREGRADWPAGVEFEVVSGIGLWPVRISPGRFEVALRELIANACQAMPNSGRVTVETANVRLGRNASVAYGGSETGDYVRVSVRDTGPGMADDVVKRALLPFFTAGGDGDRAGLGLSIVQGFAVDSGGYVELDGGRDPEGLGRGASVDLYLPREVAAAGRGAAHGKGTGRPERESPLGAVGI